MEINTQQSTAAAVSTGQAQQRRFLKNAAQSWNVRFIFLVRGSFIFPHPPEVEKKKKRSDFASTRTTRSGFSWRGLEQ